ncbi:hypothetical protein [Pseudomonas sp. SWRI92]|uniref:hypothetical protein n=1 Tax=Pseudomonas sp. SWRI92 TaxID=2745499 RepID=UPI0006CCF775|nr:hypothetical protein [Pseudomonas sp. SWRI92]KPC13288.1 Unknown protein sequence [Pseudomonas syringae pv. maculicola]
MVEVRLKAHNSHNTKAPLASRTTLKLAASMSVCLSARRHSKEFAAKASMAKQIIAINLAEADELDAFVTGLLIVMVDPNA